MNKKKIIINQDGLFYSIHNVYVISWHMQVAVA